MDQLRMQPAGEVVGALRQLEDRVRRLAALALAADALAGRKAGTPRSTGWEQRLDALQWATRAATSEIVRLADDPAAAEVDAPRP